MIKADEYLARIQSSIDSTKEMISLLQKRIELANKEIQQKTEYEANELKIFLLKTESEILTLKKVLLEKQTYFNNYSVQFKKDYDEVQSKFDLTLKIAETKRKSIPELNDFLNKLNVQTMELNPQSKIYAYKKLKKLLNVS